MKILVTTMIMVSFLWASGDALKVGDPAPEFTLMDQDSTLRSLSDFKGKKVVVYFFPKADTPG